MRRWRLVVPVCAGVGVVVLLAPLLVAPYRASTLLLLPGSGADLEAEVAPLRSRALVAAVVKELPAAEQPSRLAAALATVRHVLHDLRKMTRFAPSATRWRSSGHASRSSRCAART